MAEMMFTGQTFKAAAEKVEAAKAARLLALETAIARIYNEYMMDDAMDELALNAFIEQAGDLVPNWAQLVG